MFSKKIILAYKIYIDSPEDELIASMCDMQNIELANSPWSRNKFREYFKKKERFPLCVICLNKNNLCGFILGSFSDKSDICTLSTLVVNEKYRGNGIGKNLVRSFLNEVFEKIAAKKVVVHFRDSNKGVEFFYKKLGFGNHHICGTYKNGELKHEMEIERNDIIKKET